MYKGFRDVELSEEVIASCCDLCGALVWDAFDHKWWHENTIRDWPRED